MRYPVYIEGVFNQMRLGFITLSAVIALGACSHQPEERLYAENTVSVSSGTYAVSGSGPLSSSAAPSNPCAENFDDVISHLENLMAKNKAQAAPTL